MGARERGSHPPGLAITGEWAEPTRQAVIAVQKLTGRNEYGNLGPKTWETIDT